jgi:hypothetical protein
MRGPVMTAAARRRPRLEHAHEVDPISRTEPVHPDPPLAPRPTVRAIDTRIGPERTGIGTFPRATEGT